MGKAHTRQEFVSARVLVTAADTSDCDSLQCRASGASQSRKLTFWNVVVTHEIRRIMVGQFYFGDSWQMHFARAICDAEMHAKAKQ
jgi:hypothetical protein